MPLLLGPFTGVLYDGSAGGIQVAQAQAPIYWPRGSMGIVRAAFLSQSSVMLPVASPVASRFSVRFLPTDPVPIISRVGAPNGLIAPNVMDFQLGQTDTVYLTPGAYWWDIAYQDALGNWDEVLPASPFVVPNTPGLPIDVATFPANLSFAGGLALTFQSQNYSALAGQYVVANPTTGSFTVTLPKASNSIGQVWVYVQSSSANTVTVAPFAGDTIGGAAANQVLAAREILRLFSDGKSDWMVT